jgi:RimJ/RimL family protein N-acetyltransferase
MGPARVTLAGRYGTVAPLDPISHAESLWEGCGGAANAQLWDWMWDGPFPDRASFDEQLVAKAQSEDPLFSAYIDNATGRAVGLGSFMRIDDKNRVIEVGSLMFGRAMQRTRVSTEAMYLMARYAFEDLGYRRYEWKCNALNKPSRRTALRLGFTFEGIFRQHMIIKGANRDTAWFAMLDGEWLARKAEFERWLDPANFDEAGVQKTRLAQSS